MQLLIEKGSDLYREEKSVSTCKMRLWVREENERVWTQWDVDSGQKESESIISTLQLFTACPEGSLFFNLIKLNLTLRLLIFMIHLLINMPT